MLQCIWYYTEADKTNIRLKMYCDIESGNVPNI